MVDYQNGKIYKIVSNDCGLVYIGSTAEYKLKDRLKGHEEDFKYGVYVSSSELIKQSHYDIIELEAYPCNSKAALETQERFWMLKYRNEGITVVNINIPSGIVADNYADWRKQYDKQYRQDNKDKLKQHREENKGGLSYYHKQYREDNKQKIKEKAAVKVTCDCGCEVTTGNLTRHKKSQRHIKLMSTM